ncbi:MAG: hypothetical protein ACOYOK_11425 [Pseudobdellovibrionaceae bacterium]
MTKTFEFKSQLELGLERPQEKDRNHHLGGRSFYFFDFDDNIAYLSTPMILFHKTHRQELKISSGDFAQNHHDIGVKGIYADYVINWDPVAGSFRNYRDKHIDELEALNGKKQVFIEDVLHALGVPEFQWKGPSWDCFYHAVFNQRPVSLITARGHAPHTLAEGIDQFVQQKILPIAPNYLSIFPVNHPATRQLLGDVDLNWSTADLKRQALRASFQKAIDVYGYSEHHRFGISDDDPKNIQLIFEELKKLKQEHSKIRFFIIDTAQGQFIKHEVTSGMVGLKVSTANESVFQEQLKLF